MFTTFSVLLLAVGIEGSYSNAPRYQLTHEQSKPSNSHSTEMYQGNRTREGRIFSFNTDENEIRIELGFTIPFVTIPLGKKKSTGGGGDALANVNLGALAAGGILSAAALVFIPKLFTGLAPQVSFGRSEEEGGGVLSRLDNALQRENIDTTACSQRAMCWVVQSTSSKVNQGTAGSVDKIVDGLTSIPWLESLVVGTPVQEAIKNGRQDKNCSHLYSKCPISQEKLMLAAKNFMAGLP